MTQAFSYCNLPFIESFNNTDWVSVKYQLTAYQNFIVVGVFNMIRVIAASRKVESVAPVVLINKFK